MISFRVKFFNILSLGGDLVLTAVAFFLAYWMRTTVLQSFFTRPILGFNYHYWLVFIILPFWAVIFFAFGVYRAFPPLSFIHRAIRLALSIVCGSVIVTALVFMFHYPAYSRSLIIIFAVLDFVLLNAKRVFGAIFRKHLLKVVPLKRILVVGTLQKAEAFCELIRHHNHYGVECIGVLSIDPVEPGRKGNPVPILGDISHLTQVLDTMHIDNVVFSVPIGRIGELADAIRKCEETGVKVRLDLEIEGLVISKGYVDMIGNSPILTFSSVPHRPYFFAAKRVLDFVGSLLLLILFSPLFIVIALLIKLTSKGPLFFVQKRSGLYGREFNLIKFRTMVSDAESKKALLAHLNEMNGPVFKIKNDPRVTKIGRLLRKFSLDELPQLFNVFVGDMSLVGPRPLPVDETKRFPERWQRRRMSMKPGLTCLWQIKGRNEIDFDEWMRLDLEYIDNWSLLLDIKILLLTIPAVLYGKGAS